MALDAPLHYFDEMASTYRKRGIHDHSWHRSNWFRIYVSAALPFSSEQQVLILLAVMFNRMPYRIITKTSKPMGPVPTAGQIKPMLSRRFYRSRFGYLPILFQAYRRPDPLLLACVVVIAGIRAPLLPCA